MNNLDLKLVDPENTVVIVIDMQDAYCSPNGSMAKLGYDISPITEMTKNLDLFLLAVREKGLPIIFTRMIEDENFMPENAGIKFYCLLLYRPHKLCFHPERAHSVSNPPAIIPVYGPRILSKIQERAAARRLRLNHK